MLYFPVCFWSYVVKPVSGFARAGADADDGAAADDGDNNADSSAGGAHRTQLMHNTNAYIKYVNPYIMHSECDRRSTTMTSIMNALELCLLFTWISFICQFFLCSLLMLCQKLYFVLLGIFCWKFFLLKFSLEIFLP